MKHIICILTSMYCLVGHTKGFTSTGYYEDTVKEQSQCQYKRFMFTIAENGAFNSAQNICGRAQAKQITKFKYETHCEHSSWGNFYFIGVTAKADFICD